MPATNQTGPNGEVKSHDVVNASASNSSSDLSKVNSSESSSLNTADRRSSSSSSEYQKSESGDSEVNILNKTGDGKIKDDVKDKDTGVDDDKIKYESRPAKSGEIKDESRPAKSGEIKDESRPAKNGEIEDESRPAKNGEIKDESQPANNAEIKDESRPTKHGDIKDKNSVSATGSDQQQPKVEMDLQQGDTIDSTNDTSSAFSSSISIRSGARPLVYMYSPPKRHRGVPPGADVAIKSKPAASGKVVVRAGGGSRPSLTVAPAAQKQHQQQQGATRGASGHEAAGSRDSKNKQQQQQKQSQQQSSEMQAVGTGDKERAKRAQSGRASTRKNSRSSSSSSSHGRRHNRSQSQSRNRSHSQSRRRNQSAGKSNQQPEDREAKVLAHQLKQARTELLTARDKALENLIKPSKEKRLDRSLRNRAMVHTVVYSPSYSDTKVIDANLKKSNGYRYYPIFRGTSGALVDPWKDLALEKRLNRTKRQHQQQNRSYGSRQSQSRNSRRRKSPSRDRETSPASRGRLEERGTATAQTCGKGTDEYCRRPVYFSELPKIRSRIRASRSARVCRRHDVDYASAADECRRCLDSLPREGDSRRNRAGAGRPEQSGGGDGRQSRRSMAMSCSAYLSATPGSRAAVQDCIRGSNRAGADSVDQKRQDEPNQDNNNRPGSAASSASSDRSSKSSIKSSAPGRGNDSEQREKSSERGSEKNSKH